MIAIPRFRRSPTGWLYVYDPNPHAHGSPWRRILPSLRRTTEAARLSDAETTGEGWTAWELRPAGGDG